MFNMELFFHNYIQNSLLFSWFIAADQMDCQITKSLAKLTWFHNSTYSQKNIKNIKTSTELQLAERMV